MEITTITNEKYDTNKLSDIQAEMIETLEKSGIRAFAQKYDGYCFTICGVPGAKDWMNFHVMGKESMDRVLEGVNSLFVKMTEGKYKLAVVPAEFMGK